MIDLFELNTVDLFEPGAFDGSPIDLLDGRDLDNVSTLDEFVSIDTIPDPFDVVDSKIICPFTVIVDNQEQAPFRFLNIDPFTVVPLITDRHLKTGDYSILGFEDRLTIERKSISDFCGSITAGRDRFEREFERMEKMLQSPLGGYAAVVVEGEWREVLEHSRHKTRIDTDSILGTVSAWSMRYGVHWWFCVGGRRGAEIWTLGLLRQFWRQEQHRVKGVAANANHR